MTREGKPVGIIYSVDIVAKCPYEWESDEAPSSYNYGNDTINYKSYMYANTDDPVVSSVNFSGEFDINGHDVSPQQAQQILGPEVMKQLLNPAIYSKLLNKYFENHAENMVPPEKDYDPPERDYYD
jgi:hypothetical protein